MIIFSLQDNYLLLHQFCSKFLWFNGICVASVKFLPLKGFGSVVYWSRCSLIPPLCWLILHHHIQHKLKPSQPPLLPSPHGEHPLAPFNIHLSPDLALSQFSATQASPPPAAAVPVYQPWPNPVFPSFLSDSPSLSRSISSVLYVARAVVRYANQQHLSLPCQPYQHKVTNQDWLCYRYHYHPQIHC